ncbi:MAG TPA: hypothetical protein VMW75_05795 [Thermoanaerobaculia bacterium]|nr:hypothetical protein [Thermoanaerobaculia bacterium]
MDFFERILGFSPDGGSGTLELLMLVLPLLLAGLCKLGRLRARQG